MLDEGELAAAFVTHEDAEQWIEEVGYVRMELCEAKRLRKIS